MEEYSQPLLPAAPGRFVLLLLLLLLVVVVVLPLVVLLLLLVKHSSRAHEPAAFAASVACPDRAERGLSFSMCQI